MPDCCNLPVVIREKQRECLHGKDFSVVHGQIVIAGSAYDCSKISTRSRSNLPINSNHLLHRLKLINLNVQHIMVTHKNNLDISIRHLHSDNTLFYASLTEITYSEQMRLQFSSSLTIAVPLNKGTIKQDMRCPSSNSENGKG